MKNRNYTWIYLLLVIGSITVFTNSCKEDDDDNNDPDPILTVTDIDGNVYNVVEIGNQQWMVENLKVTQYKDSTPIAEVTNGAAWENLTTPAYCWYNNDEVAKEAYGALYNWYAVYFDNLCPNGWHVPSMNQWEILFNHLGGDSIAGGKLKDTGTTHWATPNTGATNESGFTAMPGGVRLNYGPFDYVGEYGYWWSSTENTGSFSWGVRMDYDSIGVLVSGDFSIETGLSIRCLKN